jgi:hypothetical protein
MVVKRQGGKPMIDQLVLRLDEPNYVPYVLIVSTVFAVIGMTFAFIWAL